MVKRIVLSLVLLSLVGCASASKTSTATSNGTATPPPGSSAASYPKDAQFTIFCARYWGPAHVERASRSRDELIRGTNMRDWYTVIENDQTLLYYGFYKSIEEPKAQADRRKIELMTDAQTGDRPFRHALFVELTAPDPTAPPEWNLLNAQGKYTLQIGVYKGSPQRKEAAVASVAEARKQGIPAYYYHGETASLVCVGVWPESAIKYTDQNPARSNDPEQLLIYPPNVNDPALNQAFDEAAKATKGRVVRQSAQIVDPTLDAMRKQFPYNTINGSYMKKVVNGKEQFDPSQIIAMPDRAKNAKQQAPALTGPTNQTGPSYDPAYRPPLPSNSSTPKPSQPGPGQLRGIGN